MVSGGLTWRKIIISYRNENYQILIENRQILILLLPVWDFGLSLSIPEKIDTYFPAFGTSFFLSESKNQIFHYC